MKQQERGFMSLPRLSAIFFQTCRWSQACVIMDKHMASNMCTPPHPEAKFQQCADHHFCFLSSEELRTWISASDEMIDANCSNKFCSVQSQKSHGVQSHFNIALSMCTFGRGLQLQMQQWSPFLDIQNQQALKVRQAVSLKSAGSKKWRWNHSNTSECKLIFEMMITSWQRQHDREPCRKQWLWVTTDALQGRQHWHQCLFIIGGVDDDNSHNIPKALHRPKGTNAKQWGQQQHQSMIRFDPRLLILQTDIHSGTIHV